jgi:SNF2 family DNA or RNA helicase
VKFKKTPWKHQLEAMERAEGLFHFGLFFEMGTGKTGTAINILRQKCNTAGSLLRTLIFCPPVVIENWKKEFEIHSDIKQVVCLQGPGVKRQTLFEKNAWSEDEPVGQVFVTNYEALLMPALYQMFIDWEPQFVICDESHKLKDASTKRSKLMANLVDGEKDVRPPVPYRLILTGTPVLNSPMDLFGQFRVLDSGEVFTKNQFAFRARYFYDANAHFKQKPTYFPNWQIKPNSLEEINAVIARKTMSVKKSACLDLPPLVKQRIYVDMSPEQGRVYEEMKKDLIAYMNDKACVATLALTKALRLLQIASGYVKFEDGSEKSLKTPKMEALSELLETLTVNHKVLVWAVFRENYIQIRDVCENLGIRYVEVHGDIAGTKKMEHVDLFNNDPTIRVFLGHPGSGGIGINLVSASYSIFYSRNFSLEYDLQAEARNYRGGSEIHEKVTRIDLVAKETIDELVLESLSSKQQIGEALLKDWKSKL